MSVLTDRRVAAAPFRRQVQEEAGGRLCRHCGLWREREEFSPSAWKRNGSSHQCRECRAVSNRRHRLMCRYGLTEQAYDAMFIGQGGTCALCGKLPEKGSNSERLPLVVDHCHETGQVRGLLCDSCNSALGKLGDNEEGLLRALAYVRGTWR